MNKNKFKTLNYDELQKIEGGYRGLLYVRNAILKVYKKVFD